MISAFNILPLAPVGAGGLWSAVPWFVVAVLVVSELDDANSSDTNIDVSGAVRASALAVLGPWQALAVAIVAALLSRIAHKSWNSTRMLELFFTPMFATAVAFEVSLLVAVREPTVRLYLVAIVVPLVYLAMELLVAQTSLAVRTRRPLARVLKGVFVVHAPLVLAQGSAAALIAITYGDMGGWSLIPVVALLLLMRQSWRLLLDVQETYRTTVGLLVEAAEGQECSRLGHSERTAQTARSIATKMGLTLSEVERIGYAALLHDLDAIAGDKTGSKAALMRASANSVGQSSKILGGVEFFSDVTPILRLCDGGEISAGDASSINLISAFIVALASDADSALTHTMSLVHGQSAVARVSHRLSSEDKARVAAAATSLGFKIPVVT